MDTNKRSLSLRENLVVAFLTQARDELRKVSWPSRQEVAKLSIIVIIVSVLVSLYIGAIDYVFVRTLGLII